jgi:chorismate mutase / prephenate dehydratase
MFGVSKSQQVGLVTALLGWQTSPGESRISPMNEQNQKDELHSEPPSPSSLESSREAIDAVDSELIRLLGERLAISKKILSAKLLTGSVIRDLEREERLLQSRLALGKEAGLSSAFIIDIFQSIIEYSVRTQQRAVHGSVLPEEGAAKASARCSVVGNCQDSARSALRRFARLQSMHLDAVVSANAEEVIATVLSGQAPYGMLCIENSLLGVDRDVFRSLLRHNVAVVGEVVISPDFVLAGVPGADIASIASVICHSEAYAYCAQLLRSFPEASVAIAGGERNVAQMVAQRGDPHCAAVTTVAEAKAEGFQILAHSVTNASPSVRFFVISRDPEPVPFEVASRTCIGFETSQSSGSLLAPLEVLKRNGLVLSRLESCGSGSGMNCELFFAEFEGNQNNATVRSALKELESSVALCVVLGSYAVDQFTHAVVVRDDE